MSSDFEYKNPISTSACSKFLGIKIPFKKLSVSIFSGLTATILLEISRADSCSTIIPFGFYLKFKPKF